jgi:DNA-binding response OmpR family regulator
VGVDAYLTKPFDPAELVRTVRELARQARSAGTSPAPDTLDR